MLKTFFRKSGSFIYHLRKGTARQRIVELYNQWRSENFWLDYPGWGRSFVHLLPEGVRLRLYRDDRLSELIYKQAFEANERAFVCRYLKPGMIFLDVGANIGLYSLLAAKIVGPAGHVFAVEPTPKTYQRFLKNIRINGFTNIAAKQVAFSNRDEIRDLVTYSRMYGAWNSLGGQIVDAQRVRKEPVECMRLDRFVVENNLVGRINLVKIDVEGWESFVLDGGSNTFQSPAAPDLLVEFSDSNMQTAGTSAAEVYTTLINFGYSLFRIDSQKGQLISERFRDNHPFDNYFVTQNLVRALELTGYAHLVL